jgi:hypothetical protein
MRSDVRLCLLRSSHAAVLGFKYSREDIESMIINVTGSRQSRFDSRALTDFSDTSLTLAGFVDLMTDDRSSHSSIIPYASELSSESNLVSSFPTLAKMYEMRTLVDDLVERRFEKLEQSFGISDEQMKLAAGEG